MVSSTIILKFIVLIISLLQSTLCAQDRTLISKINPGCETCDENSTLVYVKAVGNYDTIHQIWDFTRGAPTVIFVVATVNSSIVISWKDMKPDKFVISEKPNYSFAAAIDKLYEYNDLGDVGRYDWRMSQSVHTLGNVDWRLKNSTLNEKEAKIFMEGSLNDNDIGGIIKVMLDLLPYKDSAEQLPHLIHTANSTQIDISLVNLTTSHNYNSSRFAVHMLFASTDRCRGTMRIFMRKSLDDEHTPGIFEIIEIKTPRAIETGAGGFLQFRPVAYTQRERGVASSTIAHISDFEKTTISEKSTLRAFFEDLDQNMLLVEDTFISFGEPGDGFYKQHNFTAWSLSMGFGVPPIEGISAFVIIVIVVGMTLPFLLSLSGVVYVLIKKYNQRSARTRLTEED